MFVEMNVPMCDFTSRQYKEPVKGAGAVARGATGRYCVVMYAGPEYLKQNDIKSVSYEEAITEIHKRGDGYIDF